MEKIKTQLFNLEGMVDRRFLVPTYQRPYVWKSQEVEKLLSDFYQAYQRNDNHYYIGTILQYANKDSHGDIQYELIDGQQRFTTLWLIAMAFKVVECDSELQNFLKYDSQLRFDFAIRIQLKNYLEDLLHLKDLEVLKKRDDAVIKNDYVKNVHEVMVSLIEILKSNEYDIDSLTGFADFIYNNVKFVVNETPKTNLNKLFTTINSSGIQLNQSDILKSNLLNHLTSERIKYSKIWEACENMDNYFESNVKDLFPHTAWDKLNKYSFAEFNEDYFHFENKAEDNSLSNSGFSLNEIIRKDIESNPNLQRDIGHKEVRCESIINFPLLLLHTLRIFLFQKNQEDFETVFHEKNLIEAFRKVFDPDKVEDLDTATKEFFLLLWKVRFVFDLAVIKWHEVSESEKILLIASIQEDRKDNTKYFGRNRNIDTSSSLEMLQSVLYFIFDNNTQYWLTPYLFEMLNAKEYENSFINSLENIDNVMSLSQERLRLTSWSLMSGKDLKISKLKINQGYPEIKRYWFQKLEYVLWKNWDDKSNPKFSGYRITSKNSVEHVFPQNEENQKKIDEKISLHSFGNLGLLNVGQNSSYSNQDVKKKKVDFNNKPIFDSLKLAKLYNSKGFDNAETADQKEKLIKEHQEEMIDILKRHYNHA